MHLVLFFYRLEIKNVNYKKGVSKNKETLLPIN